MPNRECLSQDTWDYYRYIAEFTEVDKESKASENAPKAHDDELQMASKDLQVTRPIYLGLVLNVQLLHFSLVVHYKVLRNPDGACKIANTACKEHTQLTYLICQLDQLAQPPQLIQQHDLQHHLKHNSPTCTTA